MTKSVDSMCEEEKTIRLKGMNDELMTIEEIRLWYQYVMNLDYVGKLTIYQISQDSVHGGSKLRRNFQDNNPKMRLSNFRPAIIEYQRLVAEIETCFVEYKK